MVQRKKIKIKRTASDGNTRAKDRIAKQERIIKAMIGSKRPYQVGEGDGSMKRGHWTEETWRGEERGPRLLET
jgi:hypothetical protein